MYTHKYGRWERPDEDDENQDPVFVARYTDMLRLQEDTDRFIGRMAVMWWGFGFGCGALLIFVSYLIGNFVGRWFW